MSIEAAGARGRIHRTRESVRPLMSRNAWPSGLATPGGAAPFGPCAAQAGKTPALCRNRAGSRSQRHAINPWIRPIMCPLFVGSILMQTEIAFLLADGYRHFPAAVVVRRCVSY